MKKLLNEMWIHEGHSTRKDFWLTFLLFILYGIVMSLLGALIIGEPYLNDPYHVWDLLTDLIILYPSIVIFKRRLNDAGWSGWWQLFPILNIIVAGFFKTKVEGNDYR